MRSCLLLLLLSSGAWAQGSSPDPAPTPPADFSADRDHFKEVVTEPERQLREEVEAAQRTVERNKPLYLRRPILDLVTEAAAGLFAAGAVGLLAGSVGNAVDEGNNSQPLGGFHGPALGVLAGSAVGSAVGVWAGAELFEKDTHPGWTALGAGIGTVVGSGAAFGIAAGLGKDGETLAVGTFLLAQIGLAMVFTDTYRPKSGARNW